VANDQLPQAFADIQEDSVNGAVLPHVAGTDQAREAVLDSSIPQTAAIRLDSEGVTVEYDGTPEFVDVQDVEGLKYAVNTPTAVFRVGNDYFACEQAVWYRSLSPIGPWTVATEIPVLLYDIPPSNPHYNVVYVKVYEVTPEVVYVGYTSGYAHSYHYHGCVVYGTGWWYQPWYGHYYYPRVSTWGFRVSYNPWRGWGVGISWSNGPFTVSIGRYRGGRYARGWFGPVGFRPVPRRAVRGGYHKTNVNINTGDINIGGNNRPGGGENRPNNGGERPGGGGDRPGAGAGAETRPSNNLYNKPENKDRNAQRPEASGRQDRATTSPARNDVYSDRDGNVYRRDDQGQWQQRDQGQWKSAENLDRAGGGKDQGRPSGGAESRPATPSRQPGATQPSQSGSGSRPSTSSAGGSRPSSGTATRPGLESSHQSRQRGSQRSNSYQGSRSSGASRGGSRGGGGRRR
jgi:hypothetical protein